MIEKQQKTLNIQTTGIQYKKPTKNQRQKTKYIKAPSYWICSNTETPHAFKHNYPIHTNRQDQIRCPLCGNKNKNQTTKSTYEHYQKKKQKEQDKTCLKN